MTPDTGLSSTQTVGTRIYRPTKTRSTESKGKYRPTQLDFLKSFYAVLHRWERETSFYSDPPRIKAHPSYAALVNHAEMALPLILEELQREPSLLVWVLNDAFGERPFAPKNAGGIKQLSDAWVEWGAQHGPGGGR